MAKWKAEIVDWNSKLCEEILCSPKVQSIVDSAGKAIQSSANAKMKYHSDTGYKYSGKAVNMFKSGRYVGWVYTTDKMTRLDEQNNGTLRKSVSAGKQR